MQRRHNCSPAASFANCVMTLYLLKVHLQKFRSIPITQKCHILSYDTLVTNERHVSLYKYTFTFLKRNFSRFILCFAFEVLHVAYTEECGDTSCSYHHLLPSTPLQLRIYYMIRENIIFHDVIGQMSCGGWVRHLQGVRPVQQWFFFFSWTLWRPCYLCSLQTAVGHGSMSLSSMYK